MLQNVPSAVNRLTRSVVINHPNTWEAQVFRKRVTRVSTPAGEPLVGGLPTLGGMGVLDADDEDNIEYIFLGNGYALQAESFAGPAPMMDRMDANNGGGVNEFRFLVEPEAQSGEPGHFDVRKGDVLYLVMGDTVKLAFEIVTAETTTNIPPYTVRWVCNRRGDLDITDSSALNGWEA